MSDYCDDALYDNWSCPDCGALEDEQCEPDCDCDEDAWEDE